MLLCQSAIYKQNVSISSCLSDSVQCRRGLYFLTIKVLYLSLSCLSDFVAYSSSLFIPKMGIYIL